MTYKKTIIGGLTFFGIIVLLSFGIFYLSLGECSNEFLSCDNATKCIPQKLICDFNFDCKDKKDEDPVMCGNFYGSLEVANTTYFEGKRIYEKLKEKYKFDDKNYLNTCLFNQTEIPDSCQCKLLHFIRCENQTRIPRNFPKETVMISLADNRIIDIYSDDTFGPYKNLTYLDLRNNSISYIPSRFLHNLQQLRKLFLQHNRITYLPSKLFDSLNLLRWLLLNFNLLHDIDLHMLANLHNLQYLELSNNQLTLSNTHFPRLSSLNELFLDFNLIQTIEEYHFRNLKNLTLLSLRYNNIRFIRASTFHHLKALKEIRLSHNPIVNIESKTFLNLRFLDALYLDDLHIDVNKDLLTTLNVSFLSLRGISCNKIDFNAIETIEKLEHVVYKKFVYCSNTATVKKCFPKSDGISSTSDLLDKTVLRYAVWFMTILTCVGNISVLWGRLHDENQNHSVSLVIRNLAFSDLIMGIYLAMIGYADIRYRNVYHENSGYWKKSWECTFLGILAMTSSEVSILILTFMSIERFLLISDPFGHLKHKLDTKNVMFCLFIIWLLGIFIAIMPVILYRSSTRFYGVYAGSLCFPLFIDETYSTGWIYSAVVLIGINFSLLVLIASLYTALLFSIFRTRRATSLNFFDCEFAIRFFFIVLTDASCWAPIIVLKLLAFYEVEVSGDLYSWLVIFVIPLNSAVNPLLFTYTTPKFRDQILSAFKKTSIKKQEMSSNQITADESQTKMSLLYNSNGSISKWKIFNK